MDILYRLAAVDLSPLPKPTGADGGVIDTVINIVFGVVAAIALLMIVISGLNYIYANGDPQKIATARKSIIYAAVGIIITAAAWGIVTFAVRGVS